MDKLNIGDRVKIFFSAHPALVGEVLYTPNATGDSFHIKDEASGQLVYVQQFDYMINYAHGV